MTALLQQQPATEIQNSVATETFRLQQRRQYGPDFRDS